jgi:hypothetical protein
VQEWRLKSVVLELSQNAFIAPETRSKLGEYDQDNLNRSYEPGKGFILLDSHEGALLEHGDEINVVLKEGQTIESLRLPLLSSKHVFGLPNQPRLSRNGTIIAHTDPNRGETAEDFVLSARETPILKPSEPSSHSSSVSANPDVNYETTMRHRSAPAGWHRILVLDGSGVAQKKTEEPKQQQLLSSAIKDGKRSKPKRLLSEGSNAVLKQNTKPGPPLRQQSANFNNSTYSEVRRPTLVDSPTLDAPHSPPLSSPPISNRDIIASQGPAPILSKAERQQQEKVRKAGQRSLPAQALVIGHGVQGKVGRINSTDGRRVASQDKADSAVQDGDYGNMDAFVSFTAASSEVHQTRQTNGAGARRLSSRSATSGPEKVASSRIVSNTFISKAGISATAYAENGEATGKDRSREVRNKYVKVPERPQLPPIQNLAPFGDGAQETLLPMPIASPVPSNDQSTSSSSQLPQTPMTQLELQMANDAAIAHALSESLNVVEDVQGSRDAEVITTDPEVSTRKLSETNGVRNSAQGKERSSSSPLLSRMDSSTSSSPAMTRRSSNSPQLLRDNDDSAFQSSSTSKADRRYNEVKKALQAEKDRQAEHHRLRLEKARRASEEKMETLRKAELERRQREEKMRWQMWQDVRSRQTKE